MLAHSFLNELSSKLVVTRTGLKTRTSLISGLWFLWPIYMFFEMRFDLGTLGSGERLLPFGLLVPHPTTVLGGHPVVGGGGVGTPILGQYGYVPYLLPWLLPKTPLFRPWQLGKTLLFKNIYLSLLFIASKPLFAHVGQLWKPLPPFSVEGLSLSPPFLNPARHIYTTLILEYPAGTATQDMSWVAYASCKLKWYIFRADWVTQFTQSAKMWKWVCFLTTTTKKSIKCIWKGNFSQSEVLAVSKSAKMWKRVCFLQLFFNKFFV